MPRKRLLKYEPKNTFTLNELFSHFLYFKKAQGAAERTMKDYSKTFKRFTDCTEVSDLSVVELKSSLLHFFAGLSNKAPATYNVPYQNLNAFFVWAVEEKYLDENPLKATGLKKKRDEGRVRHIAEDNVKKLLSSIEISNYAGLRDYALIILTLDTGIRPKEAFSLIETDIDLVHYSVTIRREIAKTRMSRSLPLSPQTTEVIKRLLSVKPDGWDEFIFTTVEGYQMTIDRWEKRLKEYSKKIGCNITPYDLRHTFAIMFLRNKGNVFALQHELGHTDLTMTKRYVKLAQSDLKEQHAIASPVNKFVRRTTRIQKLFDK